MALGSPLGASAGTFPNKYLSVVAHFILDEVQFKIWQWFEVVVPTFDLGPLLDPVLLQRLPGPFQLNICQSWANSYSVQLY